jgi:hypothetical protein
MIICGTCGTKHHNLKLARGQTQKCTGIDSLNAVCGQTLTHRDAVYDTKKYDKMNFISGKKTPTPKVHVFHIARSNSAPPNTVWPFPGMSNHVTYVPDIKTHVTWQAPAVTDILLPFKSLCLMSVAQQGLIIDFPDLAATPSARAHFDAITLAMTTPLKAQDVTEAVGEASAAMAVIKKHPGYILQWGFDVHSGAGIDQIWFNDDAKNPHYLIVEAKGPTATLNSGALGNPVGYEQMEKLWIIDRLARMLNGVGKNVAQTILDHLALDTAVALTGWGGASKNYYGCTAQKGKAAIGTLSGLTVTAKWQADGMLSGKGKTHAYTFP